MVPFYFQNDIFYAGAFSRTVVIAASRNCMLGAIAASTFTTGVLLGPYILIPSSNSKFGAKASVWQTGPNTCTPSLQKAVKARVL